MPRRPPTENGRRNAGTRKASSLPHLHFLSIPLELRENIFSYLVDDESPDGLLQLLLVNRQLFEEARPFLFKRPLIFEGQSELFGWLRRIEFDDLRHVTDLTFQLQDIKPDEIVGALGKRLRQTDGDRANGLQSQSIKDNPYYEACELEVKKIGQAFAMMPNVKKLSIVPCTEGDPRPSHRMLIHFSRMLARCFPHLETLLSRESSLPINYVSNKPRLKRLQVPSRCPSSSAEVASVFRTLHQVTKLAIYGCSSGAAPTVPHTEIAAEVLRAVRPLEELTLYEPDVKHVGQDVGHEVLVKSPDAICKHLRSLNTLKVLIEYTHEIPGAGTILQQLHKLFQHSKFERLELSESLIYMMGPRLPSSITSLVTRLDKPSKSDSDLAERIEDLASYFEKVTDNLKLGEDSVLPNLEEVVILFEPDEDMEELEDSEELAQAESLFDGTDVSLRWRLSDCHASV